MRKERGLDAIEDVVQSSCCTKGCFQRTGKDGQVDQDARYEKQKTKAGQSQVVPDTETPEGQAELLLQFG